MAGLTIQQAFDLAMQHHQAGRLRDAERLYQQILTHSPAHVDALHNLGVAALQMGRNAAAAALFRQTICLNPAMAEAYCNLGLALKGDRQLDEAIASYRHAIALRSGYAEAHYNLGSALLDRGEFGEALTAFRRAIALRPGYAEAHNNLGAALNGKGQFDEAVAAYQQAIALRPGYAEAHYNLGIALKATGQLDAAIASYQQAIALQPGDADAHNNLGSALREKGQIDKAIAAHRRAIALRPAFAEALYNLGNALRAKGQLDEAISVYGQAIVLRPGYAEAHGNLGNVLKDTGQLDDAITAYRQAARLDPASAGLDSNLVYALHFHPGYDVQSIGEEHRRWNRQHAQPLAKFVQPHTNSRDPDRRLRIGYVSPNLRQHTNGFAMLPLLKAHDHSNFEIICYSDVQRPDSITAQCRTTVDQWRSIVELSDEQVAQMVRQDQIDILVDLVSHMGKNRLLVFARKPAPVQATFLGHQGTTGLSTIDYRISDSHLDPPGSDDAHYAKIIIRLPDCYLVFQPLPDSPPVKPLPALQAGHITFGSLNNFCKVNPHVLELWSRILAELPNSRLILRCPTGETQRRVLDVFARRRIESARLTLYTEWPEPREYLELHHGIDIYLDPFPHAGHTTSMDALWMGVPLITLAGATAVGRGGVFLLANLGMEELIAQNEQEYLEKAVRLAQDLARLKELRATLRQRMEQSPLMDAPKFARNIEAAYRQMWRRWCSEEMMNGE